MINPFTGEPIEIFGRGHLTDGDREAVRSLLSEYNASEPDEDTYSQITLSNGSEIQIALGTLNDDEPCSAFAVKCPDASFEVCRFLFDLAKRGHLSIGSTIDPDIKVAVPTDSAAAEDNVVESAESLMSWIQTYLDETIL